MRKGTLVATERRSVSVFMEYVPDKRHDKLSSLSLALPLLSLSLSLSLFVCEERDILVQSRLLPMCMCTHTSRLLPPPPLLLRTRPLPSPCQRFFLYTLHPLPCTNIKFITPCIPCNIKSIHNPYPIYVPYICTNILFCSYTLNPFPCQIHNTLHPRNQIHTTFSSFLEGSDVRGRVHALHMYTIPPCIPCNIKSTHNAKTLQRKSQPCFLKRCTCRCEVLFL